MHILVLVIKGGKINVENNINLITDKIKVFVDEYLEAKYPEGLSQGMPDIDEVSNIAIDLNGKLLHRYPELSEILDETEENKLYTQSFGCGFLLWGILVGSLFNRCNNNRRCGRGRSRCGCGKSGRSRCGRGRSRCGRSICGRSRRGRNYRY